MDKKIVRIVCFVLIGILVLSLIPAIALAADLAGERTVYFFNDAGWSNVNVYFWADGNTSLTNWPGLAMTFEGGYLWSCAIPDSAGYVIFNDGSTQTQDLVLPSDQNMYTHSTATWSTYVDESACDHVWDEGTVVTAATCAAQGQMDYSCTLCGEIRTVSIDATGHNFQGRVCADCGYQVRMVYYDNSNGWSTVNVYYWSDSDTTLSTWPGDPMTLVEGTIWEAGISPDAQYVIFNNGSEQTDDLVLPSVGDLYSGGAWSVYDTCEHSYDQGVITTEPGCETEGEKIFTCGICGEAYTEILAALGHSYIDSVCSVCGDVEACSVHSWDEGVVTKEPTCQFPGVRTYTCTVCSETKTASISAGHDKYVAERVEPTCIATGKEITRCTRCTSYVYSRTLPKIDHSYTIAGETVAATCTEDGYTVYSCSGCGGTQNGDLIYHLGHSWEGEICTVCGAVCQHSYVDGICSGCDDGGPAYVEGWYEIGNAAQLYWFAAQVNGGNSSINGRLIADIDLGGAAWTSIGYYLSDTLEPDTVAYSGTFDGQGHIVSDFVTAGTDNEGLFGYCSSATIMDLGVVGAQVTGWRAGAVVGYALTSNVLGCFAKDCVITGSTSNSVALESGTVYIAPVAGPQGGVVRNCYAVDCTLVDGTDLAVYTSPVGGVDTQNGYYCNITYAGDFSSVRNSTEVTVEQLASGEVTFLLNGGVTDGSQGWYQTCGVGMPAHAGLTVYQVTDCGGGVSYRNQAGELEHDYVDGVCSVCGQAVPATVPTLTLDYASLSFESEILYNVYYNASDLDDVVEMGLITFDSELTDGTIHDAVNVFPGFTTDGALYMVKTGGIAAKNMGDQMWFKVYAKLSDGSYAYTDVNYYSAVRYATSILARESSSASMKALVVAMLNYGAEAQLYFGHNTGSLMDASLTAEQLALNSAYDETMVADVVAVDETKSANFVYDASAFTSRYPSVSFDGAFSINFYFTAANVPDDGMTFYYWDLATYDSVDALTSENATGTMEMSVAGTNKYYGVVEGIAAKEMDETVFVAGVYEVDGVEYTTGIIAYSLGKYCEGIAAKDTSDQRSFAQATAVYGHYAKTYFADL